MKPKKPFKIRRRYYFKGLVQSLRTSIAQSTELTVGIITPGEVHDFGTADSYETFTILYGALKAEGKRRVYTKKSKKKLRFKPGDRIILSCAKNKPVYYLCRMKKKEK